MRNNLYQRNNSRILENTIRLNMLALTNQSDIFCSNFIIYQKKLRHPRKLVHISKLKYGAVQRLFWKADQISVDIHSIKAIYLAFILTPVLQLNLFQTAEKSISMNFASSWQRRRRSKAKSTSRLNWKKCSACLTEKIEVTFTTSKIHTHKSKKAWTVFDAWFWWHSVTRNTNYKVKIFHNE